MEATKRKFLWAGHAWRKKNTMIKAVIEEEPIGKRLLGRLRLRWKDCMKRDVGKVYPGANWRELVEDLREVEEY
jgi:hypothetical protein